MKNKLAKESVDLIRKLVKEALEPSHKQQVSAFIKAEDANRPSGLKTLYYPDSSIEDSAWECLAGSTDAEGLERGEIAWIDLDEGEGSHIVGGHDEPIYSNSYPVFDVDQAAIVIYKDDINYGLGDIVKIRVLTQEEHVVLDKAIANSLEAMQDVEVDGEPDDYYDFGDF